MRALLAVLIVPFALVFALQALWSQAILPGESISDQRDALEQAKAQAVDAKKRSELLERRAENADASADKVQKQMLAMTARIQEAEANITAAETRISIVGQLQRAQRARLAERQRPLVRLTAALQHLARRPTALSLIQPGSVRDMARVRGIMASTMPILRQRTAALRAEVTRGVKLRAQAETAAVLLRQNRKELDGRQQQLARLEARRRIESRQLASSAGLESDRAIALGEQAGDITDLMDKIRDAGELRTALAALDGPVLRPPRPTESVVMLPEKAGRSATRPAYRMPVVGQIVTGLGEISTNGVRARGLTIATRDNAQVVAPASGRVAFSGPYNGYDRILIIEHESGWTSLITNLASTSARVGDEVMQGAPIGRAGTKRPTITVELRRNGRPIDIVRLVTNR